MHPIDLCQLFFLVFVEDFQTMDVIELYDLHILLSRRVNHVFHCK